MGGLALTMSTGIGAPIPGPYLLASVAAVVLGGVVLGGGRGGLLGPDRRRLHPAPGAHRSDAAVAVDPNVTTIIEGTIMVVVVMLGAWIAMRGRAQMSDTAPARPRPSACAGCFMSDWPLVPLIVLLLAAGRRPADPAARHRQRALARQHGQVRHPAGACLAGCQTLTMLTGGIDLSVGAVATMSAFVVATQGRRHRPGHGHRHRPGPGAADRAGQRHRRRRVPRASADHDARHQPDRPRRACRSISAPSSPPAPRCPRAWPGSAPALTGGFPERAAAVHPGGGADPLHAAPHRLWPRCSMRSATTNARRGLSGVVYWQVIIALYVTSSLLAGVTGLLVCRPDQGAVAVAGRSACCCPRSRRR